MIIYHQCLKYCCRQRHGSQGKELGDIAKFSKRMCLKQVYSLKPEPVET